MTQVRNSQETELDTYRKEGIIVWYTNRDKKHQDIFKEVRLKGAEA